MPRLRDEFKGYVRPDRAAPRIGIVITVPQKGGTLPMKIRISRTAGALALASALVASGLVLAAPPKKPAVPRGQAAEHASMCRFCESNRSACFGSGPEAAAVTAMDAGMQTETCSYPPCSTTSLSASANLAELKLACASCRAICPNASGAPAVQTTPGQQK